jgi:hypothetical protein
MNGPKDLVHRARRALDGVCSAQSWLGKFRNLPKDLGTMFLLVTSRITVHLPQTVQTAKCRVHVCSDTSANPDAIQTEAPLTFPLSDMLFLYPIEPRIARNKLILF